MILAPLFSVLVQIPTEPAAASAPASATPETSIADCAPGHRSELLRLLQLELRDVERWARVRTIQITCRAQEIAVAVTDPNGQTRSAALPFDESLKEAARAARMRELVLLGVELQRSLPRLPPRPPPPFVSRPPIALLDRQPRLDLGILMVGAAHAGGVMQAGPELILRVTVSPSWRLDARGGFRWGLPETTADGSIQHSSFGGSLGLAWRPLPGVRRVALDVGARVDVREVLARGVPSPGNATAPGRSGARVAAVALLGPALRVLLARSVSLIAEIAYAQPLAPVAFRDSGTTVSTLSGPGVFAAIGAERAF